MQKPNSLDYVLSLARTKNLELDHRPNAYKEPVVSCAQAARARCSLLSCELKHLLLETSLGLCMAHLPADKSLSLRWLKSELGIAEACLADIAKHFDVYSFVQPGRISVLVEPYWSLPHIIDRDIFDRELMTTNDGTLFGYVRFDPHILRYTPRHAIAEFNVFREETNKELHRMLSPMRA